MFKNGRKFQQVVLGRAISDWVCAYEEVEENVELKSTETRQLCLFCQFYFEMYLFFFFK